MTDDRYKILALALAATGGMEDDLADLIPQTVWDALYKNEFLNLGQDYTGEGVTWITDAGREWLRCALR